MPDDAPPQTLSSLSSAAADHPAALWSAWWQGLLKPPSFAPQNLAQAINPGWTLGGVVINQANSSAPGVEQAIVAQHSYGRQIGQIMDAMCALIAAQTPEVREAEAIVEFEALAERIAAIKRESRADQVQRLKGELEALKAADPAAWRKLVGGR